jgi:uncharacterized membrane protein YagU involved in acid resistance
MIQFRRRKPSIAKDLAKGVVAGIAATWAMNRMTTAIAERQPKRANRRERKATGGRTAYGVAAEKAAKAAGRKLSREESEQAGLALHWGLGLGAAAGYALLRNRLPRSTMGNGILFGTLFWALVDEGANPLLRITPGPRSFPWQTHARGLAGHLAFGVAADRALRALDRVG